ncbi:MAG: hypothetical protein AVDCRST_MAG93-7970 [uncultured Chloroflexia bacterium]|uniref:Uncharacterized protein n=1 Tax=uncultured Chloroflexia bacterium TaxID=1672391 RepID=A0A6J4MQC5_9CHLR|nr:MAG: hypothetical protein AVDCRST_MAG93-7970 [uncultured Chloroflexia bacterium]
MTELTGGFVSVRSFVEPLRPLRESVHDLFGLPLVGLIQHGAEDLLYAYRHLPPDALLLLSSAVAPGGWAVVAVPAGRVPEDVPDGVNALLRSTSTRAAMEVLSISSRVLR